MSGGWSPSVNLFSQSKGKLSWDEELSCFCPSIHVQDEITIGGCNGSFDIDDTVKESINASNDFGTGAFHFDSYEALEKALIKSLDKDSTVLIKGSRAMKMERIVNALMRDEK